VRVGTSSAAAASEPDSKRTSLSPTDSYSQHVVTAVIVAHDGAAWLPRLLEGLGEQTKPVQRVVAVDTGSRDRSGSVLAAQLGQGAVFGMDRATGYAAAVRRAVQHKAASTPVGAAVGRGRGDRPDPIEWLWLLHDDCEPAPDALEQLLRGATETPQAVVFGPKLRDWTDRDVIVEAGLTIDTAGRRITGVEPREVDQGQHDGDRDVLAVCSAGLLVRRDVWDRLGGLDPGMALFSEDIDFCWRVHEAGFRVRVITDAIVYHARAATRGRRAISLGRRGRMLERRNGLLTLLSNLPGVPMLACLAGNLTLSLLRTVYCLVAKRPAAALDEAAAVLSVIGHPLRFGGARRRRAAGRRAAYGAIRGDLPPGRSVRRVAELLATALARPGSEDLPGAHHATDDPTDDDSLLVDSGLLQRLLTRPGVLLVIGLIVVTIAAERRVITSGTLGGGALLPAWEGATGLWSQFLQAYHPVGIGSATYGPPYLGVLAVLATVLLGKTWLAVDVLLLGCVPLAGLTAYLALRRVTTSVLVRVWAAAAYALLPIAFGAISAGRLGSAVAFMLIPVLGMLAGRMVSQPAKLARRAAWATGFTVTIAASFVPLLWVMTIAGAAIAVLALRRSSATLTNLVIAAMTPLVLLLPWLLQVLAHPADLLLESGVKQPGLAIADLPAKSLLLLSPGGPGLPPYWASAALLVVGVAALATSRRLALVTAGWCVALLGFAAALLASRVTVSQPGSQPVAAWPGVALAVAAAGLLLAAAAAADGLLSARAGREVEQTAPGRTGRAARRAGRGRARRPSPGAARTAAIAFLAVVGCTAPAIAAGWWLVKGVEGPVGPASGQVVPPLLSNASGGSRQLRTLVLASSGSGVSYLLLRGTSPQFGYPDVTQVPAAQNALSRTVAALVAPGGSEAADQSNQLVAFDIGFVLMRAPLDQDLASALDSVPGLTQVSMTPSFDLWRLNSLPSRVSVVEPNGTVVAVPSGPVGVGATAVPKAGGTLLLAEPSGGWSAAVNGHRLTPVSSPAGSWAEAFRLPPGGGTLTISRNALWHDLLIALDILVFLVVAALALPGIRTEAELEAAVATIAAGPADRAAEDEEPESVGAGAGPTPRSHAIGRDRRSRPRVAADAERAGRSAAGRAAAAAAAGRSAAVERAAAAARAGRSLAALHGRSGRDADVFTADDDAYGPDAIRADGPRPAEAGRGGRRRAGSGFPPTGAAAAGSAATEVFAAEDREPARAAGRRPAILGRRAAASGAADEAGLPGQGPVPAHSAPPPVSAWPAGTPASRFMDDPPPGSRYPDGSAVTSPFRDPRGPESGRSGVPPRSPSGNPYGEAARRQGGPDDRDDYSAPPTGPRAGSGARYPTAGGYEALDYPSPAGHGRPARGYPPDASRDAYSGQSGQASPPGYPAGRSRGDRSGYPADDPYGAGTGYSDEPSYPAGQGPGYGEASDRRWHRASDSRAGWPTGEQHGWPQEHLQGWPQPAGQGSGWQPRPGEELDPLGPLPPGSELHHDGGGRRGRPGRAWPAPDDDDEGETW
jgi:GT2 family glycosyltransferase